MNCLLKDSHFHIQSTIHTGWLLLLQLQWWITYEYECVICWLLKISRVLIVLKVWMYDFWVFNFMVLH